MENKGIICQKCKSKEVNKDGKRKTENRGLIQRYRCKKCSHRFILDDGFKRMRNHPKKITLCLDLFFKGVSTRKVQEHLQAFYPANSSHKSIYKWIIKYSNVMSDYTDNLKLNVGKEIQLDEMEYHRRKSHKKGSRGIDKNWFIDVIDNKTRYMIASKYVKSRSMNELTNVMKQAKNKTEDRVSIVTTDGLLSYPQALRNSFGLHKHKARSKIIHNQVNASKGEGFNIMIERLHNSVRQLTQNFRGFHGSVYSANSIMKGYEVYYNFIRKHQGIKKCPYELATNLELKNPNKWLELINRSME